MIEYDKHRWWSLTEQFCGAGHSHGGEAEHHIEEREALMVNGAGENSPSVTVQIENPHGHSHSKGKKRTGMSVNSSNSWVGMS